MESSNQDSQEAGFTVTWDKEDSEQAIKHGWDIFTIDGTHGPDWQLQRIDCPDKGEPVFRMDSDAWLWVWDAARHQVPIARKALQFIKEYAPNEYNEINKKCSFLGTWS